jgi:intracellular sulfur oxidation DsrE/DsrF family protein
LTALAALGALSAPAKAGDAPWGTAKTQAVEYAPAKVVYDLFSGDDAHVRNILDRVSMLQNLYGADPFDASIVVVIHGEAIPVFAIRNTDRYKGLMTRAASLIQSGVIQFRMCGASAKLRGFGAGDIHGFVTMVPMADAEIVRLQRAGYAYMQ